MTAQQTLYHYTCDHGFRAILDDGFLKPGMDGLVWLTDLEPPAPRLALGLTSFSLNCDRLKHVFKVPLTPDVVWWMDFRRTCPSWLLEKESPPGVLPMHWFVSRATVPIAREVIAS